MAIATNCPSCEAKFKLSDELEGKTVKCKRCQSSFVVPSPEGIAEKPSAKAAARRDRDEDEDDDRDERPSRKSRRKDDDKDDDDRDERPSRKSRSRDDDDDDDDEPRRRPTRREKRKKKKKSSMLAISLILAGVAMLLLVSCGVGGVVMVMKTRGQGPGGALAGAAVTPVVFGADNTFRHENRLTRFDRVKDARRYRTYTVQLEAGKTYQFDMISRHLDSFLFVLDDTGRVVAEDDDSGGNLNSRIVFRCDRAGEYTIETTSFDPGETGTFLLVVRRF